jgi:hypothetical protein
VTTGEVAAFLGAHAWQVRRVVDDLEADLPRAGLYRLIPRSMIGQIEAELQRRGWLPAEEAAAR